MFLTTLTRAAICAAGSALMLLWAGFVLSPAPGGPQPARPGAAAVRKGRIMDNAASEKHDHAPLADKPKRKPKKTGPGRFIWPIVRIAVLVYLGLALLLLLFQGRLVYHPMREIEATPQSLSMEYEDVRFTTSDGVEIAAWFVPARRAGGRHAKPQAAGGQNVATKAAGTAPGKHAPRRPRGVVLFCHGNGGNISHRLYTLHMYHRLGFAALIFDYRGYGRSAGSPSEQGTYKDAEAAWEYLIEKRGCSPADIVVHGRSLGGAVAAYLAEKHKPALVILESTFSSIPDVGAHYYPFLPIRWLARIRYNTLARMENIRCRVLSMHSKGDGIIPYKLGRRVYEAANEPKDFIEMTAGHNEGFSTQQYEDSLADYFNRVVPIHPSPHSTRPRSFGPG